MSGNFSDVVSVHLHQPTTLHCDASDPKATISWQRNDGKPFTANVQSAGNDLIFTSVTAAEQGVYKCVASSTFGNVHKDVEIKLVGELGPEAGERFENVGAGEELEGGGGGAGEGVRRRLWRGERGGERGGRERDPGCCLKLRSFN